MRSVLLLVAIATAVPSIAHAEPAPTCGCPSSVRKNAKWVALGGVTLIVGSAIYANRTQNAYNDPLVEPRLDKDDAKTRMRIAGAVGVTGMLAVGTSALMYFVIGKTEPVVAPVVTQDRVGLAFARRF